MSELQHLTPHLMFQDGRAEEALNFYVDLFNGEVTMLQRYNTDAEKRLRIRPVCVAQ